MPLSERYIVDDAFQKTIPDAEADCDTPRTLTPFTLLMCPFLFMWLVACTTGVRCSAWHGMAWHERMEMNDRSVEHEA